jgi:hypothetical protein
LRRVAAWKIPSITRDDEERTIVWRSKGACSDWRARRSTLAINSRAQMIVEQASRAGLPDTWQRRDHRSIPKKQTSSVCVGGKPWMVAHQPAGMKHTTWIQDPASRNSFPRGRLMNLEPDIVYMTCSDRQPGELGPTNLDGSSLRLELSGKAVLSRRGLRGFSLLHRQLVDEKGRQLDVARQSVEGMMT